MLSLLLLALPQAASACPTVVPDSAVAFAPHLADSARIFRGTFSADGTTLYYFRRRSLTAEDYQIMVARLDGGRWSEGTRLDLGGDFSDLYPSVSPDGHRLVFSSYRPAPGDTLASHNAYLWYADRTETGWGPPQFIGAASAFGSYHSGPLIGADYSIRFRRTSPDWTRTTVLETRWDGSRYRAAEPAGESDLGATWSSWRPTEYYVWGGELLHGGTVAILDVSPLGPTGRRLPAQVWVSVRRGSSWSEPVPAGGGVNRGGWANFVILRPDRCSVLFVRDFSRFETVSLTALAGPARAAPLRQP